MQKFNRVKPKHLKTDNSPKHNIITNRDENFNSFYQSYQHVLEELFSHLREQNSELSELIIFEKARKLLDRMIFICFCEDTGLLPHNMFRRVVEGTIYTADMSSTNIWTQLKGLTHTIDHGNTEIGINCFNGELFKEDTVLDHLVVQDAIFPLFKKVTCYDFATDFDVSLLGYIFEQSIDDAEAMKAVIMGEDYDPRQGRRKKDGIFYTSPDVIRLLLQETLLKWIDERKDELDECFTEDGTEQPFECDQKLQKHLESVKILDPAAGSGAFLNMTYDMLMNEWNESIKNLPEAASANAHHVTANLFGVELNEDSLKVAKQTLWLKSAVNRQGWGTPLENNLKTGNAIINQPFVSEQAFDWHQEFPRVMDDGGFDVIIGNPPYVFARNEGFTEKEKNYFNRQYILSEYQINTYLLFIERSYHLLKEGGWLGFIVPNNLLTIDSCKKMRRFLLKHTGNLKIINIHNRMFEEADVDTCLLIFQKTEPNTVKLGEFLNGNLEIAAEVEPEVLLDDQSIINISLLKNKQVRDIMNRIETGNPVLSSLATVKSGLVAYEVGRGDPKQTKEMKENRVYHSTFQVDDTCWMYLEGSNVCRYKIDWGGSWLQYGPNLAARRNEDIFKKPRILIRQIPSKSKYAINAVYTEKEMLNDRNSNNIIDFNKDPLFLLGVINSKITTFWFIHKFDKFQRKTFPQFKVKDLKMFPVPDVSEIEMKQISKAVARMLDLQRLKCEELEQIDELLQEERQLNEQIDRYAADAFGLSGEDLQLIDTSLEEFLN